MPHENDHRSKHEHKPKTDKPKPKHHESHDRLRAFEHLGRVSVLLGAVVKNHKSVAALQELAERELHAENAKGAADLLRAAEHLSFADLHEHGRADKDVPSPVEEAARDEIDRLLEKADEHWTKKEQHSPEMVRMYEAAVEQARRETEKHAFRRALELARGAEALAHVKAPKPPKSKEDGERG